MPCAVQPIPSHPQQRQAATAHTQFKLLLLLLCLSCMCPRGPESLPPMHLPIKRADQPTAFPASPCSHSGQDAPPATASCVGQV